MRINIGYDKCNLMGSQYQTMVPADKTAVRNHRDRNIIPISMFETYSIRECAYFLNYSQVPKV